MGGCVTGVLTALLVVITGFYAWATFRILRANEAVVKVMKDQLEAQGRPYVHPSLFVVPGTNIFGLRIKNAGRTAANDLRLTIDKDFFLFGERKEDQNLRTMNAFSAPIASFPPNAEIEFWLAQGPGVFAENVDQTIVPRIFSVRAAYTFSDRTVSESTTLDFGPYLNANIPRDSVVTELEKIRKSIETLALNVKKL
jgi:hypothetical protein